jgi:hypothetical protein
VDNANGMREAVKFIAEYDDLIAVLEKQAGACPISRTDTRRGQQ